MKALRYLAFILCLAAWGWFGWYYAWPVAVHYFYLMELRQGFIGACVSMFITLLVLLWVYYAATMNLKRAIDDGTAPLPMMILGYTLVLPPALFLDWLVNMLMTVVFIDWPEHLGELVTGRLKRYAYQNYGSLRRKVAFIFADILDALDPSGKHI
jgi:hypothetical protein